MAFNLFGAPKRRSRSRGGGGGKALNTIILIGGLGAIGIVGYWALKSGKGFGEASDTLGRGLKNLVDAGDSTFDAIAKAIPGIEKGLHVGAQRRDAVGKAVEEFDIVKSIQDAVGGYSKGVADEIKKNEDRSWINRESILGLGCGVWRKC
jgi:hypothetical protein